jgi:hypothetical protein
VAHVKSGVPLPHGKSITMATSRQIVSVNPTCEHGVYLRLFVTSGGGL